jgi:uncharacterized membrane protein YhaH (DUF805 family)
MSPQQKIAVAIIDVLIIVELCISMYFAARNPDAMTPIFMKSFFAMLIPTLITATITVRRLRTANSGTAQ